MNNLKKLRTEKHKSLEEVAKVLGVSLQTIFYYENEKRDMSTENLQKLADYFNVSTDYILGKTEDRKPSIKDSLDEELLKFGLSRKKIEKISDEEKAEIKKIVEYVLSKNGNDNGTK